MKRNVSEEKKDYLFVYN